MHICKSTNTAFKAEVAAISFLARDAMTYLPNNLRIIEQIAHNFARYRFFYLENDSSDGTGDYLRYWSLRKPVTPLHFTQKIMHSHDMCPKSYNCIRRFKTLSILRDELWKRIRAWDEWTIWMAIDADFIRIQVPDILKSIALGYAYNAAAMFSRSYFVSGSTHRIMEYEGFHISKERVQSVCPVNVTSAFGGVAIYYSKIRRIYNLSYDRHTKTYEHFGFHSQIKTAGHQLFINPKMNPLYTWGSNRFWKRIASRRNASGITTQPGIHVRDG